MVTPASMCPTLIPAPQHRLRLRQVDPRVDPLGDDRVVVEVRRHAPARTGQHADRVRHVQLSLIVVGGDSIQRRPELVRTKDVVAGVHLGQPELVRRGVARLHDPPHGTVVAADDAAEVGADHGRPVEAEDWLGRALAAVVVEQRRQRRRVEQGMVGVQHQHVAVVAGQRVARREHRVARAPRDGLDNGLDPVRDQRDQARRTSGEHHHDGAIRADAGRGVQRPLDQRPARRAVQQLRRLRLHPRALATGKIRQASEGWGVRSREGWDTGAPRFEPGSRDRTRCLTAWPRPMGPVQAPCEYRRRVARAVSLGASRTSSSSAMVTSSSTPAITAMNMPAKTAGTTSSGDSLRHRDDPQRRRNEAARGSAPTE